MASISLCMIVRDEEATLGRALESARGVVDELCIVDTGSRDATIAIAEAAGARVERVAWHHDFSAARNHSLALARGDWVLVLDADEQLLAAGTGAIACPTSAAGRAQLRDTLVAFAHEHPACAGQVEIAEASGSREGGSGFERGGSIVTRFVPMSQSPRFVGRIHEQLVFADGEAPKHTTGVRIAHDGYTPAVLAKRDKLARNRELLETALADGGEGGNDPFLWWHLGRTHALAGRPDDALDSFVRALDTVPRTAPYLANLVESTGYAMRELGRSAEALGFVGAFDCRFPARADLLFLIALLSMDVGQLARAERGFRRCLELAGQRPEGGPFEHASSTSAPAYNLGVMCEVQGQRAEALAYYRRALTYDPGHEPSRRALARLDANGGGPSVLSGPPHTPGIGDARRAGTA